MNPETIRGLLEAIQEAPDDDNRRLVYADALDDAGEGDYGQFIRTQVELSSLGPVPRREDGARHIGGMLFAYPTHPFEVDPIGSRVDIFTRHGIARGCVVERYLTFRGVDMTYARKVKDGWSYPLEKHKRLEQEAGRLWKKVVGYCNGITGIELSSGLVSRDKKTFYLYRSMDSVNFLVYYNRGLPYRIQFDATAFPFSLSDWSNLLNLAARVIRVGTVVSIGSNCMPLQSYGSHTWEWHTYSEGYPGQSHMLPYLFHDMLSDLRNDEVYDDIHLFESREKAVKALSLAIMGRVVDRLRLIDPACTEADRLAERVKQGVISFKNT